MLRISLSNYFHLSIKLKAFSKFESTTAALESLNELQEGSLSEGLKAFLKTELKGLEGKEKLAISDSKLAKSIAKKFEKVSVVSDSGVVMELMRGIRSQLSGLLNGVSESDLNTMALGLSHSMSRYKLKFSPDKVDTMIIQAIALLDDLDKELNTYTMRLKEWYGWHFPELAKVLTDNVAYAKFIQLAGFRTNISSTDFSTILPEELEKEIKELAEVSMGTEISDMDLLNINHLADQIISLSAYRAELFEYLKNRMAAIAPNLTALVGELVGARLISHAGSLMNLAKHPASTVQILGAEKALFRALKTKQNTPKYGLIFHASLVGQAGGKLKGKIARVLAAKASLAVRVDALSDANTKGVSNGELGTADRAKIEHRLRVLERQTTTSSFGSVRGKPGASKKYDFVSTKNYNPSADVQGLEKSTPIFSKVKEFSLSDETPKASKIMKIQETPMESGDKELGSKDSEKKKDKKIKKDKEEKKEKDLKIEKKEKEEKKELKTEKKANDEKKNKDDKKEKRSREEVEESVSTSKKVKSDKDERKERKDKKSKKE